MYCKVLNAYQVIDLLRKKLLFIFLLGITNLHPQYVQTREIINFRPMVNKFFFFFVLVIALRPQSPKHIRGGWSHYTDTSEPVDGNGSQNMVTVQSRI
jgi:hypothetical protein